MHNNMPTIRDAMLVAAVIINLIAAALGIVLGAAAEAGQAGITWTL